VIVNARRARELIKPSIHQGFSARFTKRNALKGLASDTRKTRVIIRSPIKSVAIFSVHKSKLVPHHLAPHRVESEVIIPLLSAAKLYRAVPLARIFSIPIYLDLNDDLILPPRIAHILLYDLWRRRWRRIYARERINIANLIWPWRDRRKIKQGSW